MDKSIRTEIIIDAPKNAVWDILTDFSRYAEWNPFIIKAEGNLEKGRYIRNTMLNDGKQFVFKPRILSVIAHQYFDWLGSLFIKGLFDGHHYFEIEEISPNQTRLIQGEHFSGILSGIILRKIAESTRKNFISMNVAVKQRAETNTALNTN